MQSIRLNKQNNTIKIVNRTDTIRIQQSGRPGPTGAGVPTGGAAGQVLAKTSDADYDTAWEDQAGGGSGSPGGSNGQIQYNDHGVFGGDSGLVYDENTQSVTVAGNIGGANLSGTNTGDQDLSVIVQDKNYIQNFTVASTVTVTHNLNKYPTIAVIDSANDEVIGNVEYTSLNSLVLTFSAAFSGRVTCN